jgi:hypothetical protein
MAQNNFRNFISPDFQASQQPMMEWMPWENQEQQGADLGSILGQLKPQGQAPAMGKGDMMAGGTQGKNPMMGAGSGKSSL